MLEEINFYIPSKSPANIANTAFAGRLENIINLQDYVNDVKVIQFTDETQPYSDPNNAIFFVDIAMSVSDAVAIAAFKFKTVTEAKKALRDAHEELFRSLKEYIYKVEGSLQRVHFYKDRIVEINKLMEYF